MKASVYGLLELLFKASFLKLKKTPVAPQADQDDANAEISWHQVGSVACHHHSNLVSDMCRQYYLGSLRLFGGAGSFR